MDMDAVRGQAAKRAQESALARVQSAHALAKALENKKKEAHARREAEARAKERRRAEIYALNHILREHFRSIGACD